MWSRRSYCVTRGNVDTVTAETFVLRYLHLGILESMNTLFSGVRWLYVVDELHPEREFGAEPRPGISRARFAQGWPFRWSTTRQATE